MDFMEEKASEEVKEMVSRVATAFSVLIVTFFAGSQHQEAGDMERMALMVASAGLSAHAARMFGDLDPDTVTTAECYDLLFRVTEQSIPFVMEVENTLSEGGIHIVTEDGKRPSDFVREALTA